MGQIESKIDGSYTFAYLHSPRKQLYLTPAKDIDPILSRPDVYGLGTASKSSLSSSDSSMSFTQYESRHDSGYLSSYDDDLQLSKDLAYVDTTYYLSVTSACQPLVEEKNSNSRNNSQKISITDVMLASPDRTLNEVYLSSRSIHRLSSNMGFLTMIRKLDLSNNDLIEIPESIGYMQNLESLLLAKNRLRALPDTIGYLSNLLELDVSYNEITVMTPHIGYLEKLKTLSFACNQLSQLPTEIRGLGSIISLDLSGNPLRTLPAEVTKLPYLRRMRLDGCPLDSDISYSLYHDPPSLMELCARSIVRKGIPFDQQRLPDHMVHYLKSAKSCTCCLGPYFESFVVRGRLMEKIDVTLPLQYTLCSSHWIDTDDRVRSMFSVQPETCHDALLLPSRPRLPLQQAIIEKKASLNKRRTCHPVDNLDNSTDMVTHRLVPDAKFSMDKKLLVGKSSLSKLANKLKRPSVPWRT